MKKSFLLLVISLLVLSLPAHEFWLQPEKFIYQRGEPINIRFWVGENFEGQNWSGSREKINSLRLYLGDIYDDLSDQISDEKGDSLQLGIYDEGTAMVTFNSNNSFIQLDSAKFNDYLKEDGLNDALQYRTTHHELDSSGREYYQRSVKTLVQVGVASESISHTTDLPLDIVPVTNPYFLKKGDSMKVKIYFKKQLLAGQLLKLWHRVGDQTLETDITTGENGQCSFEVLPTGKWMLSTVKMIRLENDEKANWQSYWGSCTWGYE